MREIPIYLFTGFLEAGKTKFIQGTLEDARFNDGERTLVLLCEEGFEEYDVSLFPSQNVYFETIENESDLTPKLITSLSKKHKAERIIIEYNGMWQIDKLFSIIPRGFIIAQEMCFMDTTTFLNYNENMRSLVVDKFKSPEVVIFNRTTNETDKFLFHKIVRGANRRVNIVFEYTDGRVEYDETEDPLPYNLDDDIVVIKDVDYAEFFRDMNEDTAKYHGKKLMFKAIVAKNDTLPENLCLVGRHIMICCEDDIEYGGMLCVLPSATMLQSRDWIMLTATLKYEYHPLYECRGPVLYAEQIVHSPAPEQLLATFY